MQPSLSPRFRFHSDSLMQAHIRPALGDKLPGAASRLMRRPADGTANAARVLGVERTNVPGLSYLRLAATNALKRVDKRAESGLESATAMSESDFDGPGDTSVAGEYSLPVLCRKHCDGAGGGGGGRGGQAGAGVAGGRLIKAAVASGPRRDERDSPFTQPDRSRTALRLTQPVSLCGLSTLASLKSQSNVDNNCTCTQID